MNEQKPKSIMEIIIEAGYVMVTRCKDCKNFDTYNVECMKSHFPKPPYDAWYCADGERKESGEAG